MAYLPADVTSKVNDMFINKNKTANTRSSADADNALDANEAVPNKWRADGTHNTYQSY